MNDINNQVDCWNDVAWKKELTPFCRSRESDAELGQSNLAPLYSRARSLGFPTACCCARQTSAEGTK